MKNIVVLACCRSGHNFIMNQIKSWTNDLVYNFEDVRPIDYDSVKLNHVADGKIFNPELETINIIVVRDLLNWWASYLKWITKDGIDSYLCTESKLQNAFDIWTDIAKEGYCQTNYIDNKSRIGYDLFSKHIIYRRKKCLWVGGNYNEDSIDLVSSSGDGSSFDNNIKGSEMQTDLRYKQILLTDRKDLYLSMLKKNKKSINLYKMFFNLTDEQKSILK